MFKAKYRSFKKLGHLKTIFSMKQPSLFVTVPILNIEVEVSVVDFAATVKLGQGSNH